MLLFIVSSKLSTVKIKGLFQIGWYGRQFKCLYLDGRVKSESPELYWLTKARDKLELVDANLSLCFCLAEAEGLLRQCPHHGFSELHQLDTFYNSLNTNDQNALDSAAGGNYLDKMPRDGTMAGVNVNTLTMEQYLALSRDKQAPGVVKPEIEGNVNFKIKSQFMREFREDTFSGNKNEDAHDPIDQVLSIVGLFNIPGVSKDAVML
ncbi:hypothetical protein Tco_0427921 [Tanacetum coccineum]